MNLKTIVLKKSDKVPTSKTSSSSYFLAIFFFAGLHKLAYDGWAWAQSDPVGQILWRDRLISYPRVTDSLPAWQTWLIETKISQALSWYSLVLELVSPLAFLHQRIYWLVLPQLLLMLGGMNLVISRNFLLGMLPLIVVAIAYGRTGPFLLSRRKTASA